MVAGIHEVNGTLSRAIRSVRSLPRNMRYAAVQAGNDALFAARLAEMDEIRRVFDRPTPFIQRSVVVRPVTAQSMRGELYVDFWGSSKGVPPEKVLAAEVFGGRRRAKRAEVALQRVGVLPRGMAMVPGPGAPLDAYGNVRGSFIVQILSYFRAFSEQGYRANMSDKRRRSLAKRGRTDRGFATIRGVEYFASAGRGTYGALPAQGRQGREQHLPPGIWSRSGIHGSKITAVFRFVRMPSYGQRYNFHRVAQQQVQQLLPQAYARRLQKALAS